MHIRTASYTDLDSIYDIESASFPNSEAATYASLAKRLQVFPDHHWVLEEDMNPDTSDNIAQKILGFIGTVVTSYDRIQDEMFTNANLHNSKGNWLAVLSLAIAPAHRNKGFASQLLREVIQKTKANGKTGITLTCKKDLVGFYEGFGFKDVRISASGHGGAIWHDMVLAF